MSNEKTIKMRQFVSEFAENKDVAREIRESRIRPALENGDHVVLDFSDVNSATQSFVHALLSELIRIYDVELTDMVTFKDCSATVKEIIGIVFDYMLERD